MQKTPQKNTQLRPLRSADEEYSNYSNHTASCFSLALFCTNVFASRSKAAVWLVPSGSGVFPSGNGLICPADSSSNSSPMRADSPVINFQ